MDGRLDCDGDFMRRLLFVVPLIFLLLSQSRVFAAENWTIEPLKVGRPYAGKSASDVVFKLTPQGGGLPRYVTRSVPISTATAARAARAAVGGPLHMAVVAAMIAAEYFVDEQTGDIMVPGTVFDPSVNPELFCLDTENRNILEGAGFCALTRDEACAPLVYQYSSGGIPRYISTGYTGHAIQSLMCTGTITEILDNNYRGELGRTTSVSVLKRRPNQGQYDRPPMPAPDSGIADALPEDLLESVLNDIIRRRGVGVAEVFPELGAEMDAVKDAFEASSAHSSNPSENPAPTQEQSIVVESSSSERPSMSDGWPGFCSWATVVCDFIDWFRAEPEEPENVPLPYLDLEIPDYAAGLPSVVSCPAPVSVDTELFGSFELSYQPFCDLAEYIRYAVLGIAYLFAAYTVVGVRR